MPRSCVNRTASRLLWGHRPSTLAGVQLQPPIAHGGTLEVAHCPVATRLVGPPTFCSGWGAAAACRCARGDFRGGTLSGGHQTFDSCRGAAAASPCTRGGHQRWHTVPQPPILWGNQVWGCWAAWTRHAWAASVSSKCLVSVQLHALARAPPCLGAVKGPHMRTKQESVMIETLRRGGVPFAMIIVCLLMMWADRLPTHKDPQPPGAAG
jgi:hypothetical protein